MCYVNVGAHRHMHSSSNKNRFETTFRIVRHRPIDCMSTWRLPRIEKTCSCTAAQLLAPMPPTLRAIRKLIYTAPGWRNKRVCKRRQNFATQSARMSSTVCSHNSIKNTRCCTGLRQPATTSPMASGRIEGAAYHHRDCASSRRMTQKISQPVRQDALRHRGAEVSRTHAVAGAFINLP